MIQASSEKTTPRTTGATLDDSQQREVLELWESLKDNVEITARYGKAHWCSKFELSDLKQEGFQVLLSCLGKAGTPGKYDGDRSGNRGKTSFKTFFITSFRNRLMDLGAMEARKSFQPLSDIDPPITFSDPLAILSSQELFDQLEASLSDLALTVFRLKWESMPIKISTAHIARALNLPYEHVLTASKEIQQKLSKLRYNDLERLSSFQKCFGWYPNNAAAECRSCCDFKECLNMHNEAIRIHGRSFSEMAKKKTEVAVEEPESADPKPEKETRKPKSTTLLDLAFRKLTQGPASKDEMFSAIIESHPEAKSSRVADLEFYLRSKKHPQKLITKAEGSDQWTLIEGAIEYLQAIGALTGTNSSDYKLKQVFPAQPEEVAPAPTVAE